MKKDRKFTKSINRFFLTCNQLINSNIESTIKVLCEAGTGAGKTTMISHLHNMIFRDKVIYINLAPSIVVVHRIKKNQLEDGINPFNFKTFCKETPGDNIISIVDTWGSINNKNSTIHEDGDNKGIIKILKNYEDEGYTFVVQIDEAHSFIVDDENESSKILSFFPNKRVEIHYTATPDETIVYDKIISIPDEEIIETGRLKSFLELMQEGHNDDFEIITDSIKKLKNIEPHYDGDTVTLQIFCPTGVEYKHTKQNIFNIAEAEGIESDKIFDLTIEGRGENEDKNIETFINEVSQNPKHNYKIILTKYAGGVGLDCPSIGIQCFLRTPDKNSIKAKIQYFGRGRRSHRGIKPKNKFQDTLYVFVKENFIFPEYQSQVFKTQEKTQLKINEDLKKELPMVFTDQKKCEESEVDFMKISKIFSGVDFKEMIKNNFSVGKKYNTKLTNEISGETINSLMYEDYRNDFEEVDFSVAIPLKKEIELKWNDKFENGFSRILEMIQMKEFEFLINIKKSLKFRDFFYKTSYNEASKIIANSKSFNIEKKEYVFLNEIEKHKTHISEEISEDSVYVDKLLYKPTDNLIYFDSMVEKDVFNTIMHNRRTNCFIQNLRTNQGGVSFYIQEKDVFHSPDFIFICNGNLWFAEITDHNNLSEKIDFIKSNNTPKNYMLIIKDSKKQLICLLKENFVESNYYNTNTWKKLSETYVNL
jgi:superfamily II DNA or RNA helicase